MENQSIVILKLNSNKDLKVLSNLFRSGSSLKSDILQFLKNLRIVKEFEVLTNREDHQVLKELYSKDLKLVKEL